MHVITFLNQKGGVGKTSTTHHLGGTLAKAGVRVLLIDADPQSSLSQGFFGPEVMRTFGAEESVAALFNPTLAPIPEALIRPTGLENVSIVPGSEDSASFNITPFDQWGRSERGVAEFLAEVRDDFDVVLIDPPPNLYFNSWAALVASDFIVVPLQAEDYGSQGLGPVQRSIHAVQVTANPSLRLLGYLLTMHDKRLGIHSAYETMLRQMYGEDVFANVFPLSKDFKESVSSRLPISHYKPKSASAKAAKAVADEMMTRLESANNAAAERSVA